MAKLTKRQKAIAEKVEAGKQYAFEDAAKLLAEVSAVKFAESFDIAINLGVDPRKSDQVRSWRNRSAEWYWQERSCCRVHPGSRC